MNQKLDIAIQRDISTTTFNPQIYVYILYTFVEDMGIGEILGAFRSFLDVQQHIQELQYSCLKQRSNFGWLSLTLNSCSESSFDFSSMAYFKSSNSKDGMCLQISKCLLL